MITRWTPKHSYVSRHHAVTLRCEALNVCRLALKCDGAWVHFSGARQFCGKPCKGCKRRSISYILDNRHIPEKKKLSKCYCKAWGTKIITSERSIVEKACESCLDVITFSSLLSSSLCLLSSLPPVFAPILNNNNNNIFICAIKLHSFNNIYIYNNTKKERHGCPRITILLSLAHHFLTLSISPSSPFSFLPAFISF